MKFVIKQKRRQGACKRAMNKEKKEVRLLREKSVLNNFNNNTECVNMYDRMLKEDFDKDKLSSTEKKVYMTCRKYIMFNDYKNNYWWPHLDRGYNAIVYLNTNDYVSGTNLYENLNLDEEPLNCPEHFTPWRNKNNFRLVKTLMPRYNRLVLFDGLKFHHGMNICNDDYFHESYRFNQVFFFKQNN